MVFAWGVLPDPEKNPITIRILLFRISEAVLLILQFPGQKRVFAKSSFSEFFRANRVLGSWDTAQSFSLRGLG